jgi:hypothetical protein
MWGQCYRRIYPFLSIYPFTGKIIGDWKNNAMIHILSRHNRTGQCYRRIYPFFQAKLLEIKNIIHLSKHLSIFRQNNWRFLKKIMQWYTYCPGITEQKLKKAIYYIHIVFRKKMQKSFEIITWTPGRSFQKNVFDWKGSIAMPSKTWLDINDFAAEALKRDRHCVEVNTLELHWMGRPKTFGLSFQLQSSYSSLTPFSSASGCLPLNNTFLRTSFAGVDLTANFFQPFLTNPKRINYLFQVSDRRHFSTWCSRSHFFTVSKPPTACENTVVVVVVVIVIVIAVTSSSVAGRHLQFTVGEVLHADGLVENWLGLQLRKESADWVFAEKKKKRLAPSFTLRSGPWTSSILRDSKR